MSMASSASPSPPSSTPLTKNGVKAIAEYFIPRDPQYTEEWLYKDENGEFPYAKKMVEIARYYGFDGYFINQEGAFRSLSHPPCSRR